MVSAGEKLMTQNAVLSEKSTRGDKQTQMMIYYMILYPNIMIYYVFNKMMNLEWIILYKLSNYIQKSITTYMYIYHVYFKFNLVIPKKLSIAELRH